MGRVGRTFRVNGGGNSEFDDTVKNVLLRVEPLRDWKLLSAVCTQRCRWNVVVGKTKWDACVRFQHHTCKAEALQHQQTEGGR